MALAEEFMSTLVLPGCQLTSLWTRRPELDAKLNVGDFSDRRWKASLKKFRIGEYHVLRLEARNPDWPNHKISFGMQINPPAGQRRYPVPAIGDVSASCSLSYLRYLAESPDRVEALIHLGKAAWDGVGDAAYGFANVAYMEKIVPFNPTEPRDPDYVPPWDQPKAAAARHSRCLRRSERRFESGEPLLRRTRDQGRVLGELLEQGLCGCGRRRTAGEGRTSGFPRRRPARGRIAHRRRGQPASAGHGRKPAAIFLRSIASCSRLSSPAPKRPSKRGACSVTSTASAPGSCPSAPKARIWPNWMSEAVSGTDQVGHLLRASVQF